MEPLRSTMGAMGGEMSTRFPAVSALATATCGILGAVASFIYFNIDPVERMAAEADGMPFWSVHQLPFTLPWGLAGAAVGLVVSLVWRRRTRSGSGSDYP